MPRRSSLPCPVHGCGKLTNGGRCEEHRKERDRQRGSRHERGYDRDHERWRAQVLRRDHGLCQPCRRKGRTKLAHAADHIVPFDQGGARLDPANGQGICSTCHGYKTAWERASRTPWPETEAGVSERIIQY